MAQRNHRSRRWVYEESKTHPCAKCGRESWGRKRENGVQMWVCLDCAQNIYQANNKVRKQVTHKMREEIYQRDGYKCVKCGTATKLTIDHIKPIALGGDSSMSNLQTLCQTCNYGKADRRIGV